MRGTHAQPIPCYVVPNLHNKHDLRCLNLVLHQLEGFEGSEADTGTSMASVTSNELCKECQILVSDISCEPGPGSLQHHRTMESLNKSSKNACGICIELLRSLRDAFASETADALEIFFPINCIFDTSSASWQSSFEMTFNLHGHPDFSLRFVLEVVEESECEYMLKIEFVSIVAHVQAKVNKSNMRPLHRQTLLKAGT